jgi:hypothetical protein
LASSSLADDSGTISRQLSIAKSPGERCVGRFLGVFCGCAVLLLGLEREHP